MVPLDGLLTSCWGELHPVKWAVHEIEEREDCGIVTGLE